jgi:plastocyanin
MRFRLRVTFALFALLAPAPAASGNVRGVLWVSRAAARKPAGVAGEAAARAATVTAQRGVTEAVVWIDQVPEKVEEKLAGNGHRWFWQKHEVVHIPCVVQRANVFAPRVLAVPSGGSVEFRNLDHVYHNVFSVSSARRFDLGKHAPGRADTVAFTQVGVVNLHCDIHPSELGFVVVVPNHTCVRPDSLGAFEFPKLPPGTYTVRAWHPRLGELKRTFEVQRRGDVGLQLVY